MRKLLALLALCAAMPMYASSVTATITDTDGQTWNNAKWSALLTIPGSVFNPDVPRIGGVPVYPIRVSGTTSAVGVLTQTLTDTSTVDQFGAKWVFTICSNTSMNSCSIVTTTVIGSTVDMSATFAQMAAPRFAAIANAYGYVDAEVQLPPPAGATYFNVTDKCLHQWNGQTWTTCSTGGGGGGGGGVTPSTISLFAQYNTATTVNGATGVGTDSATKTGLFQASVNPGQNSFLPSGFNYAHGVEAQFNSPTQSQIPAETGASFNEAYCRYRGYNWGNYGGWSVCKGISSFLNSYTRGIGQPLLAQGTSFKTGDFANYFYIYGQSGQTSLSDEGNSAGTFNTLQYPYYYVGTVGAGGTTGTTLLPIATGNNSPTIDGGAMINITSGATAGGYFLPYAPITAWSFDGTATLTLTSANTLRTGDPINFNGFITGNYLNGLRGTVIAGGGTSFTATVTLTHIAASATEVGYGSIIARLVPGTAAFQQQIGGVSLTPSIAYGSINNDLLTVATGTNGAQNVITSAWTIAGNVATIQSVNQMIVGQQASLSTFAAGSFFNGNTYTITAATGTSFQFAITHASASATESGYAATNPQLPVIQTVDYTDTFGVLPSSGRACFTGGQPEQVNFTATAVSGGHQQVTISHRQPHLAAVEAMSLWYGGPCGQWIDVLNESARGGFHSTYFVAGALDAKHIVYAWNIAGTTSSGLISTKTTPVSLANALRTGSTVTSILNEGSDVTYALSGAATAGVILSNNAALLGTVTNVTQIMNPTGLLIGASWTQAGTNGDASTGVIVGLPSSVDAFTLYCGAENIAPSVGGLQPLEPNGCAWNTGDAIWSPPGPSFKQGSLTTNSSQETLANGSGSAAMLVNVQGHGINNSYSPFLMQFSTSMYQYKGHGGTESTPDVFSIHGTQSPGGLAPFRIGMHWGNSGTGGAPLIVVDSDEFGTNLTRQTLAQIEQGTISYFNPTQTWYMNNLTTGTLNVTNFTAPSLVLGQSSQGGVLNFTRLANGTVAARISLCEPFGTANYLGVGNCNRSAYGGYNPDGTLAMASLLVNTKAQLQNVAVAQAPPLGVNAVYAGAVGSDTNQYFLLSVNALGQSSDATDPNVPFISTLFNATLGGGNTNTITCPSVIQPGWSGGTTVKVITKNFTTNAIRDLGTCTYGSTLVDAGAGTSIATFPIGKGTAQIEAGNLVIDPLGSIDFPTSIYNLAANARLSNPSVGVVSVDTTTIGNGSGTIKANKYQGTGTGAAIATGTASNTDVAGRVTLVAGTFSYTLASTYTSPPIVTCIDTSATPTLVGCHSTTTQIIFNGTGTDVINYILIGLN
jgi:hypothetical protein